MSPDDAVSRVWKLRPGPGDVICLRMDRELEESEEEAFAEQLGAVSKETGATLLILPPGTDLDELDDRQMAGGGWVRVPDEAIESLALARRIKAHTRRSAETAVTKHRHGGKDDEDG